MSRHANRRTRISYFKVRHALRDILRGYTEAGTCGIDNSLRVTCPLLRDKLSWVFGQLDSISWNFAGAREMAEGTFFGYPLDFPLRFFLVPRRFPINQVRLKNEWERIRKLMMMMTMRRMMVRKRMMMIILVIFSTYIMTKLLHFHWLRACQC